jgi:hypothetical protein
LADGVEEGMRGRQAAAEQSADQAAATAARPRRSRRLTTSQIAERAAEELAPGDEARLEAAMPIEAVATPTGGSAAQAEVPGVVS